MAALDMAVTKRIKGILLAQLATSVSFNLYLAKEPKYTADGMISLKGFKMRSVPVYDAFLQSLGATTVTVQVPEIYNALERGLVNGFAFPGMFTRKFGWAKFIKYRVYPTFYQLEPAIFMTNKALKKLSPKGRALIRKLGREWEHTSYNYWKPLVQKEREILAKKYGQKEITLNAAAAKKYISLANGTPVERLKKVGTPEAKTLSRLYHGQ
jgi:TRAP-type C4-dicarboxylate transport system substrate-binding protein